MTNNTVTIFETQLSELKQTPSPLVWSSPRGNLGYALLDLQQSNIDNLKKAIMGYEDALNNCNQEEAPHDWGTIQHNLANALHALGQQEKKDATSILNDSMEAYKNVLMVWKRQELPLAWASILNNIGMIFQRQGEQSNGSHTLMKSISAFNNALTQRTAEHRPQEWAITQNNVGASLQILSEIKEDKEVLEESLTAYKNALQKIKPEQDPLGWVTVMSNLYSLQRVIAKRTKEIDMAKKSVVNSERVVEFLADTTNAEYLKLAQKQKEESLELLEQLS